MFSGTDTLDTSSLVEVATRYLWFTLLRKEVLQLSTTGRRCLPQWAAVELVWSSDEQEASAQLLQDNDALACEHQVISDKKS